MIKIDFNSTSFTGFKEQEDILLDTGILLAYLNKYDSWHNTVSNLFNTHVFNESKGLFLYINPCILNELVHLTSQNRPIENYLAKHSSTTISPAEIKKTETRTISAIELLIKNKILLPLDGTAITYLNQLKTYSELGSADAFNASLANEYGISFLTVDNKLVTNIMNNLSNFNDIDRLYHTTNTHRT